MNIRTEYSDLAPASHAWRAYDADTYEVDCDQDGYFSTSPVGHGATKEAAIADLAESQS